MGTSSIAWAVHREGRSREALKMIEQALGLDPCKHELARLCEYRSQILISLGCFEEALQGVLSVMGAIVEGETVRADSASCDLVENLHLVLVLYPSSKWSQKQFWIWEWTLRWLLQDSLDRCQYEAALDFAEQLAYYLSFERPADSLRMCLAWIEEAENLQEMVYVDGLLTLLKRCENSTKKDSQ